MLTADGGCRVQRQLATLSSDFLLWRHNSYRRYDPAGTRATTKSQVLCTRLTHLLCSAVGLPIRVSPEIPDAFSRRCAITWRHPLLATGTNIVTGVSLGCVTSRKKATDMCGIAGVILDKGKAVSATTLQAVTDVLRHRGPDDTGFLHVSRSRVDHSRGAPAAATNATILAHHRLAILDLSAAGRQPLCTEDGRYHVVFNGEVYNYIELRTQLQRLGYSFTSGTDTEVVLKAFAAWGVAAFQHFTGMFALACLDFRERRLLLVRDQFGIKPLYYTQFPAGFAFASEIKALLKLPGVARDVNPHRALDYLRFGLTDHTHETMLSGIKQIPAAHYMEISLDNPRPSDHRAYWTLPAEQTADLSFEEASREMRERFLRSMELHMRSDVPVGAALSGGIDSSAIVMCMRKLNPQQDIHTFSYVATGSSMNEEPYVDIIANEANTIGHKLETNPSELLADLDDLIAVLDEPFGSTSVYAQYRIFKSSKHAGIKVMLDGQGGDELLAGYSHYITARLVTLLRQGHWIEATRFAHNAIGSASVSRNWLAQSAVEYLLPARFQKILRWIVGRELFPRWLNAKWFQERNCVARQTKRAQTSEVLKEELHRSLTATMMPHLLRYEDRNSMAFSVESRVPFLTPDLVSFTHSLPDKFLISNDGTTKAVFRAAMRGIVPNAILDRRDKIGFETPEHDWLNAIKPYAERVLRSDVAVLSPCFNLTALNREWGDILAGRTQINHRAWRWLNFLLWAERHNVCYA